MFYFYFKFWKINFGKWKWCLCFEINLLEGWEKVLILSLLNVYIYKEKKIFCKFYMRIVID